MRRAHTCGGDFVGELAMPGLSFVHSKAHHTELTTQSSPHVHVWRALLRTSDSPGIASSPTKSPLHTPKQPAGMSRNIGTTSSHVITATTAHALSSGLDALVVRRGGLLTSSALVSGLDATMQQCTSYISACRTGGASAAGAGFGSGAATARAADQHNDARAASDPTPLPVEHSIRGPLRKSVSFIEDAVTLLSIAEQCHVVLSETDRLPQGASN